MIDDLLSYPLIGDEFGKIICTCCETKFEGNVLLGSKYQELSNFMKLELINDVVSVFRNEYQHVTDLMEDEKYERKYVAGEDKDNPTDD